MAGAIRVCAAPGDPDAAVVPHRVHVLHGGHDRVSVQWVPDCKIWKVSTFPSISLPRAATGEAVKYYSTERRDTRISLPPAAAEFTQHIKLHLGALERQKHADMSDSLDTAFVDIQFPYFC